MSVSVKEIQMYPVHIIDDLMDSDERIHHAFIVPTVFNLL